MITAKKIGYYKPIGNNELSNSFFSKTANFDIPRNVIQDVLRRVVPQDWEFLIDRIYTSSYNCIQQIPRIF